MWIQYIFKKLKYINSINLLRILLGLIMVSHGSARVYYESIPAFGNFLGSKSVILGNWTAYIITILDIVFGLLLICNKHINCISYWFIFILLIGIILVHFKNGWFVIGHGQNGIEYSLLLICCFILLLTQKPS